jgi:hypothetical protein
LCQGRKRIPHAAISSRIFSAKNRSRNIFQINMLRNSTEKLPDCVSKTPRISMSSLHATSCVHRICTGHPQLVHLTCAKPRNPRS